MTEQQQHLANLLEQRDALRSDLEKLQEMSGNKRELFLKVQGAIEYLIQIGVKLPEPEAKAEPEVAEVVEEAVSEEPAPAPKRSKKA